ncbi:class I SAM-dependent methyltransferase [Pseudonocardia sichuanensis]
MKQLDLGFVTGLYRRYAEDLAAVGAQQRAFAESMGSRMTPQLDDLEAEITYLLLRETRPAVVMELGTFHGWSTSWILSALRDNGSGRLHSFDRIDNVVRNVPEDLAEGRWTFVRGDIKQTLDQVPADTGYLFVDAAHNSRFARWYLEHLFPRVPAGIPVSVHDVYHFRATLPLHEGKVVVRWLDERGVPFFTPSRAKSRTAYDTLTVLRQDLGLAAIRGAGDNPMIFFEMPAPR